LLAAVGEVDRCRGKSRASRVLEAGKPGACGESLRTTERRIPEEDVRHAAAAEYTAARDGHNTTSLLFPNGSRIVGLPGTEATVRGFSAVSLLLIDEASRVPDEIYKALRPTLAVGNGDLWLMSTPHGQRGFFYETWVGTSSNGALIGSASTKAATSGCEWA
jgi:hypothetical protein